MEEAILQITKDDTPASIAQAIVDKIQGVEWMSSIACENDDIMP